MVKCSTSRNGSVLLSKEKTTTQRPSSSVKGDSFPLKTPSTRLKGEIPVPLLNAVKRCHLFNNEVQHTQGGIGRGFNWEVITTLNAEKTQVALFILVASELAPSLRDCVIKTYEGTEENGFSVPRDGKSIPLIKLSSTADGIDRYGAMLSSYPLSNPLSLSLEDPRRIM